MFIHYGKKNNGSLKESINASDAISAGFTPFLIFECKTTKINSFYLIKFEEAFLNFRIF